jgi:repressor LexA
MSPRAELTPRQQNILDFVTEFQGQHGFPPSMREIGEFFGIRSTNGVSDHLRALEKKGFLNRSGNLSRCLQVVREDGSRGEPVRSVAAKTTARPLERRDLRGGPAGTLITVPILGKVAAGLPLLAVEQAEDEVVVDSFLLGGPGEVFGLRVVGESMIDAGIMPGDFLFVRRRSIALSGQIVVAMIDGEATVKRFFPEGDVIRFQPENKTMQPILVRRSQFQQCDLLGTVVGVYRKLT